MGLCRNCAQSERSPRFSLSGLAPAREHSRFDDAIPGGGLPCWRGTV